MSVGYVELYQQCNGGHLFATERCPMDGWSTATMKIIYREKMRQRQAGLIATVATLRGALEGRVADSWLDALVEVRFPDASYATTCFVAVEEQPSPWERAT